MRLGVRVGVGFGLVTKERRKAERKWRTTKKTADFNKFKSLKNHCTQLMRKAKCSFFSDFVKENSNNQGTLFKAIKGILVEKKNVISFPGCNETALVNELGKYFVQKISNIHSEINNEISSNDDGHVDPPSDDNEEYPGDVSHFDAFEP